MTPTLQHAFCLLVLLIPLAWGGCASARRGEPIREPLEQTDTALVRGEQLFMEKCNKCHPHGESGLGPSIANKTLAPSFAIRFQVRHGLGAMPSFSDKEIPSSDLDAILLYLSALQHNKER